MLLNINFTKPQNPCNMHSNIWNLASFFSFHIGYVDMETKDTLQFAGKFVSICQEPCHRVLAIAEQTVLKWTVGLPWRKCSHVLRVVFFFMIVFF